MDIIRKLPPEISGLIAAGEVVDRPAAVIKELMENSIDAGAKAITVEIQNGGVSYMRVTDDGCGIGARDAETAFLRHATSKISSRDDLERIRTLGFRGEALAATASVSVVELLSKTRGETLGASLTLKAGELVNRDSAGCPDGTTIIVRDLFFNVPARMKFLKKDATESANVAAAVFRTALSHPEISVKFIKDGKTELHSPGGGSLYDCIYAVMGRDFAASLIETKYALNSIELDGYITKPSALHSKPNRQHFFLNGRYIRSRAMAAALEEGYKNSLMTGRYPGCVLHMTMDPTLFDVNVHPAKTEVKFANDRPVFDCVMFAVRSALQRDSGRTELAFPNAPPVPSAEAVIEIRVDAPERNEPVISASAPYKETSYDASVSDTSDYVQDSFRQTYEFSPLVYISHAGIAPAIISEKPEPAVVKYAPAEPDAVYTAKNDFIVIGEALSTYIVAQTGDELLFIDKHAAHERVIFERLKNEPSSVMSQLLITPLILNPGPREHAALLQNTAALGELGFEIDDFGGGSVVVRRIPSDIDLAELEPALEEIAASLLDSKNAALPKRDGIIHTIACKAAIKAGKKSSSGELYALVSEVLSRDDLKYCPHGRPVCISMSRRAIEKQFGR